MAQCAEQAAEEQRILIHADSRYAAYTMDLDYMWRWEILRDGEFVQEGCSLSLDSAREAVSHVLRFFQRQDEAAARPGDNSAEIKRLLQSLGTPIPIDDRNETTKNELAQPE
ncbi:soluble methane monooxygenase-binding protein MmoD [Methylosinus sp. R-45379]|jgi:soluble methane monooxygenase-binding protein MmoD|uniref:soluble methane monooxygenase-binding protein MmoD n=1 Tax=unclassified Methylosinus TaxID=2624500 RepID=UPI00046359C8|nr:MULTISPECIES: soluble methane monooxygenase-binding protein MmoD [unclassified Methylosinus]OAI29661.1 soluble methane monooxygenase-binding protein MmoD [Methylosinus sp. R-45379]TDX65581.1 soluble methane monooxygenase-binding protein MmoD [Methylosinus sp. sav-2]